jgi:ubiquinone biosynthesis protein COQ9
MTDDEFDAALIAAAFAHGAAEGWRHVSAAAAARRAGLDLATARARFAHPGAILKTFGKHADAYALAAAGDSLAASGESLPGSEASARDRLFDLLLRRFDYHQIHRAGVLALLQSAPLAPGLPLWLGKETLQSMGWMLEGAGLSAKGWRGALRAQGLAAVWVWGTRAWIKDETADLSATMAAVDVALDRASQIAGRFEPEPPVITQVAEPEQQFGGGVEPPIVLQQ